MQGSCGVFHIQGSCGIFHIQGPSQGRAHGTQWDSLKLFASPGNPKGSFHHHSERGRRKSLQRFVKALTQGTACLITLVLWSCWSFPKKGMEELHWGDIFVPEVMGLACIFWILPSVRVLHSSQKWFPWVASNYQKLFKYDGPQGIFKVIRTKKPALQAQDQTGEQ